MARKRVPLYERLPEIYRIKDGEQSPPDQLKAYLGLFEDVLGSLHENIEQLYHDLFIETCDPWEIPYIGPLLATTHAATGPRTKLGGPEGVTPRTARPPLRGSS